MKEKEEKKEIRRKDGNDEEVENKFHKKEPKIQNHGEEEIFFEKEIEEELKIMSFDKRENSERKENFVKKEIKSCKMEINFADKIISNEDEIMNDIVLVKKEIEKEVEIETEFETKKEIVMIDCENDGNGKKRKLTQMKI